MVSPEQPPKRPLKQAISVIRFRIDNIFGVQFTVLVNLIPRYVALSLDLKFVPESYLGRFLAFSSRIALVSE